MHGRAQCGQRQRRIDVPRDRVSHHLATAGIENGCEIAKARSDPDVGEVGDPNDVRASRDDVAIEVGEDRQFMLAACGANEAPARLDTQALGSHHSCHSLAIDHMATATQFMRDAPVTVAGQFVLNGPDQLG